MDIRTLLIALLAHISLLGVLAIYFGVRQAGTRAISVWGAGTLMLAAGYSAIALRGVVPDLISITVANTILIAANLIFYRALRVYTGRSVDDPLGLAALAATTILIYIFSAVVPNIGVRVVVVSLVSALMFVRNALELRGPAPAELRASLRFMQGVFWLVSVLLLLRVAANLYLPSTDLLAPSVVQSTFFLAVLLLSTTATFGMFWMEIQSLHLELARQAARDSLTGMLNRHSFHAEFERELARVRRGDSVLGLAIFDLDRFKQLNDTYGHPAGDEVLRSVAASMQASIRQQDILGRYGGEEFALVMPDTDAEACMRVAERIRAAVQACGAQWQGQRLSITISGGIAAGGGRDANAEALIAAADAALYSAKDAGRNCILQAPGPASAAATGIHAIPPVSIRNPR